MQEKPGKGLQVTTAHEAARFKGGRLKVSLRGGHTLILNRESGFMPRLPREHAMPIFEYICKECDHSFEALVYGSEKAQCPKCRSKKLAPQLSTFAVSSKGSASRVSSASAACGSCGDPRGPGACSLRDIN